MRRRKAFTLIELLVVVAIIALLVAILVPTMEEARHQAKVVVCSSNLHQIGVGMMTYASAWGEYPPSSSVDGSSVWDLTAPWPIFDNRQNLVDAVEGIPGYWVCPVRHSPEYPLEQNTANYPGPPGEFWPHFRNADWLPTTDYVPAFLFIDRARDGYGLSWDWSGSGNPDLDGDGVSDWPRRPGHANAAIVMDDNGGWPDVEWSLHSPEGGPYKDGNVLFGDAHVETRYEVQNCIIRVSPRNHLVY